MTGREVRESKLAKVPKAKLADSATNAGLLGGATPTSYRDACPTGSTFENGACYEMSLRAAATYPNAVNDCDADGMRVPTFDELESLRLNGVTVGAPMGNYELSSTFKSIGVVISIDASSNQYDTTYGTAKPYRCVGLPTNLP